MFRCLVFVYSLGGCLRDAWGILHLVSQVVFLRSFADEFGFGGISVRSRLRSFVGCDVYFSLSQVSMVLGDFSQTSHHITFLQCRGRSLAVLSKWCFSAIVDQLTSRVVELGMVDRFGFEFSVGNGKSGS